MFLKFSLIALLVGAIVFYLKYTEPFYLICKHISEKQKDYENFMDKSNDFLSPNEDEKYFNSIGSMKKFESIKHICKEFFTDYSNHTIMRYTLDKLNKIIYGDEKNEINDAYIIHHCSRMDLQTLKYVLHTIKFIHLFAYSSILYLIIITLPNIIVQVIMYIFNRVLIIIFVILLIEAFLIMYVSIDTDLLATLDKTAYSKYTQSVVIKFIIDVFGFLYGLIASLF
jgi:hypothetical protein